MRVARLAGDIWETFFHLAEIALEDASCLATDTPIVVMPLISIADDGGNTSGEAGNFSVVCLWLGCHVGQSRFLG